MVPARFHCSDGRHKACGKNFIANSLRMSAIGITVMTAIGLHFRSNRLARAFGFVPQIFWRNGREVRVCPTVAADSEASAGERPYVFPRHEPRERIVIIHIVE